MNRIVQAHPGREIHVILDNFNTHKPKRDRWLARHKNVHFHDTPTGASWLNAFIASYNKTARPFAWSKSEVHQKRLKPRFADL